VMQMAKQQAKQYIPSLTREEFLKEKKQNKQYFSIVKKSNALIQKARYTFSLQQQKILCFLITHLAENDTHETEKKFDIKTFYDFMEVDSKNYERVRENLKALRDKSWFITSEDGTETSVSFLTKISTNKRNGTATVFFDRDILPYLQELKTKYTTYKLYYIMTMKSQYSIRLYELFKSVAGKTNWYFSVEELRKLFMCEKNYSLMADFKKRVIEPAIKEINEKTDITVDFTYVSEGRKILGIDCHVEYKNIQDRLVVDKQIRAELDGQTCFD